MNNTLSNLTCQLIFRILTHNDKINSNFSNTFNMNFYGIKLTYRNMNL